MVWTPLLLSLQVATLAMLLALVVGTALALLLSWTKLPARELVDAIVSAPLVLPPTVLGYYLLVSLGPDSLVGRAYHAVFGRDIIFTFTAAVIAAAVGSIPLVVRSVRDGLEAIEPNLLAAARTLGASPVRVLATVRLPLAAPSLMAGAMLAFARALGDYGATQMFASTHFDGIGISQTSTASIFIYDELLLGPDHEPVARALAIATTVVGVTLLFFANRLTRRLHPHR